MVHVVQSSEDFKKQISDAGDKLILIDFNADWCGPCKRIAPKVDELACQYAERAIVLSVNIDEHMEITMAYNIRSMPTFVFVRCGFILESFVGSNADRLSKTMDKYANDIQEMHFSEMDLKPQLKQLPNSPLESVDEAAHMVTECAEPAATNNTNCNSNENREIANL
ncbi:thioredoxin-2 [Drosophila grimshawi]|uniref:GH24365 n=1 Tax=Drosophila grimshawi TaxID=7222 RepID=B4JMA6_DROGR|nr:thioredoxin-2 [Drosophila grimshawi]EDV91867.1 GH24365 [Drosophila grimshawi]